MFGFEVGEWQGREGRKVVTWDGGRIVTQQGGKVVKWQGGKGR